MRFFKTRELRTSRLKDNHAIRTIFGAKSPDWHSWLYWFLPIIQVVLTPVIIVTTDIMAVSTYYLIAVNSLLFVWHLYHTLTNLYYDGGNRSKHLLDLVTILAVGAAGAYLALVSLPLTAADQSIVAIVFYVINFTSTLANLGASLSGLFFPWLLEQGRTFKAFLQKQKRRVIKLPTAISNKLTEAEADYLNYNNNNANFSKLLENDLGIKAEGEGIDSSNATLISARKKAVNLYYTLRLRKQKQLAGELIESKIISTAGEHAYTIQVDGNFTEHSPTFTFFRNRVEQHSGKLLKAVVAWSEINEICPDNVPEQYAWKCRVIKALNKAFKIDNLSKVVLAIGDDINPAPNAALNIGSLLSRHVFFSGNPKDATQKIQQLQEDAGCVLKDYMLTKLLKLHDEEGYSVTEINRLLAIKIKNDHEEGSLDKLKTPVADALKLLTDELQERVEKLPKKPNGQRKRICPLGPDAGHLPEFCGYNYP